MTTLAILGMFVGFLFLRVPVALAMLFATLVTLVFLVNVPLVVIPQFIVAATARFEFLAIPFFILAAELMNSTGMTMRIFRFANVLTGWLRGGLMQVNIAASVIFAGISGTAVADAAGLGRVQIEAMRRAGYRLPDAAGITLASCIIGPLVPPSVIAVIYAISAEVSVGRMLLAGLAPGLLLAAALMLTVYWRARTGRLYVPEVVLPTRKERRIALREGLPAIGAPFIILYGIVSGVITPTEAGVAACVYAILVAAFWYRDLTFAHLKASFIRATLASSMIMFIIACASVMSFVITREQAANDAVRLLFLISENFWLQLLLINLFLFLVGCFVEGIPAMLILIPVMLPLATQIGLDPVHFGCILIFNLLVGIITPPMGVGLLIMANITGLSVWSVFRGALPFLLPLFVTLMLITYVPQISLFLPDLMFGRR